MPSFSYLFAKKFHEKMRVSHIRPAHPTGLFYITLMDFRRLALKVIKKEEETPRKGKKNENIIQHPSGGVLLIVLSLLLSMMPAAAFAADVPVLLTASEAGVDVTVSENITLTSQAGSADLIVSDLTVKNNASIGSVEVTGISATAENGWSLVPADSGFEAMQANTKKLYLGYGSHEFSAGTLKVSDMDIAPGQTETISLSAKTGIVTTDISSQKVATVVITVGIKKEVQLI